MFLLIRIRLDPPTVNIPLGNYNASAGSLIMDYILTVAASSCDGAAAITSAFPSTLPYKALLAFASGYTALTEINRDKARGASFPCSP